MAETLELTLDHEIRAAVYHFLAGLYLAPPDPETLAAMGTRAFEETWPLGRGNLEVERGLDRLSVALEIATPETVRAEFWHLFGTLGPAAAPPWESVYLDPDQTVFGAQTLAVRELYARFGFRHPDLERSPDDQIGLQLEFLSRLASAAAERLELGDTAGAEALTAGVRECLNDHLLRWVASFVERIERAAPHGFYAGVGRLTLGALRADQAALR